MATHNLTPKEWLEIVGAEYYKAGSGLVGAVFNCDLNGWVFKRR
jgi:hypothetical protein